MKIVQFKNGKYGIRRLTMLGYRFLGLNPNEDYWWGSIKDFVSEYATMSKEEVIDRWKRYPLKKERKTWDNGKIVKLKELE